MDNHCKCAQIKKIKKNHCRDTNQTQWDTEIQRGEGFIPGIEKQITAQIPCFEVHIQLVQGQGITHFYVLLVGIPAVIFLKGDLSVNIKSFKIYIRVGSGRCDTQTRLREKVTQTTEMVSRSSGQGSPNQSAFSVFAGEGSLPGLERTTFLCPHVTSFCAWGESELCLSSLSW